MQNGVDGAVRVCVARKGRDQPCHHILHPDRLGVVDARSEMLVAIDGDMGRVEGNGELAFGDDDRRPRFQRIANAEFEDCVRVGRGQIGDDQLRLVQELVHRHVDHARLLDLVRPDALIVRSQNRWLDDAVVALVEIELAPRCEVGLLAEAHNNKADRRHDNSPRMQSVGGVKTYRTPGHLCSGKG